MSEPVLVENPAELERAAARLGQRKLLGLDLETGGLDPHLHPVLLLTLGDDREQVVVDCRKVALGPLTPLLEGPILKVAHNGAFDTAMLRSLGIRLENVVDTMLIEQLIEGGRGDGRRSLSDLAERYLGRPLDKGLQLSFAHQTGSFSENQLRYAQCDVLAAYLILLGQLPALRREGLEEVARIECHAVPAFADLRYDGVYLDRQGWSELIEAARSERERIREEVGRLLAPAVQTDLFGRPDLNLDSDQDLRAALSRLLRRPVGEIHKEALRRLDHPIGEPLARFRELSKLVSTYGQSFLESIHPRTGRIHADFVQIGAPTGRVACRDPNLQNIPRGSEFRRCFRAPPGRALITADYAGCELRILAEASGDPAFVATFQRGGDLHAIVASEIFGRPVSKETNPELRDRAKAINFGLAYGMGAAGLAAQTHTSPEEAEALLKRYFGAFPRVRQYLEDTARSALERGYATTLSGRKLRFGEGNDPGALARVAKNMPIQGTNADMLKVAMAGIRRRLKGMAAFMVNCVHDEILAEADRDAAWDVAEIVRAEMIRAGERFIRKVPVLVDVSVGEAWQK